MRKEHVEYYVTKAFHEWFRKINNHMGDSPFQAVIQNFVYYPDAKDTSKSRLEVFVRGLIQFVKQLEAMPDDRIKLKSLEIKGVYVDDSGGDTNSVPKDAGFDGSSEPVVEKQEPGPGAVSIGQPNVPHVPV